MSLAFLCVGAAHWDVIARTAAPLPPGADVPGSVRRRPGGVALNVALALAGLGRSVVLVAAVGRDVAGDELAALLSGAGVGGDGLHRHDGPSDSYLAIESADGALVAGVADCAGLERAGLALLAPLARLPVRWTGTLIVDGNLTAPVLDALLGDPAAAAASLALIPASPRKAAGVASCLARRPLTLYLNRAEAEAICGRRFADSRAAAEALLALGAAAAVVTDGAAPATAAGREGCVSLPPPAVATFSLTGAGDAFVAAHLAARADGLAAEPALRAALAASARHIARAVA